MDNKITGNVGEAKAYDFLLKNGYKIIKKNFECFLGEIDIIATKDNYIIFVEIKARATKLFGLPREAVTKQKQNKIKQVALFYLKKNRLLNYNVRFDVIEIINDKIEHLINCF